AQCAGVERRAVPDLTVGDACRTVDQDVRAPQETQPAARRAEPLELVVGRHRYRNGADDGGEGTSERRTTFLAGALEIGFQAPYPGAELIVIARLDTADHAVDFLGRRYRCASYRCARQSRYEAECAGVQGSVVPRITPAVADVGAPVHAESRCRRARAPEEACKPAARTCPRPPAETAESTTKVVVARQSFFITHPHPMFGPVSRCPNV